MISVFCLGSWGRLSFHGLSMVTGRTFSQNSEIQTHITCYILASSLSPRLWFLMEVSITAQLCTRRCAHGACWQDWASY